MFNVRNSSPKKGTIKLILEPTEKMKVGDSVEIYATLESPGDNFEELFWVKFAEPDKQKDKTPNKKLSFELVADKTT